MFLIEILAFVSLATSQHSTTVKPEPTEEAYWETVKDSKIQMNVMLTRYGEVNSPPDGPYLKVICISDTHDRLDEIEKLPDGDVLIHAGDLTNFGSKYEIERFNQQIARFKHPHKLVIAGNHELGFEEDLAKLGINETKGARVLKGVTYLQDSSVDIDGVKFYGAPWHPMAGFPFYRDRLIGLKEKWKLIPNDTDVLITHTPPVGYLDLYGSERRGCRDLLREVETRVKPKFHVFGHVHDGYGVMTNNVTTFINAAQMRKGKVLETRPITFYIPKKDSCDD